MNIELPSELKWLFRAIFRRWYLGLIPIVIVGGYTAYSLITTTPTTVSGFTTVVRFSAAQSIDAIPNRDGDFQDVWLSSELTVKALTSWAQTTSFKREVAARAATQSIIFEPSALPIAADHERSIGQLFLSWNNADELTIIAEAALDVLREDSQRYFPQFGNAPAQVTILDDIQINAAPLPIVDRFESIMKIGLAIFAGLILIFLAEYLDPTLHTRDELEYIGLNVIVSVPRE